MTTSQHIVLAGAGYSNLIFLNHLRTSPPNDIPVTLVTEDRYMLYSGKMPGLIAGMFQFEDCSIDVETLCTHAKAKFIEAKILSIKAKENIIELESGESISYDILSINIGGATVCQNEANSIGVKPITKTFKRWRDFERRVLEKPNDTYAVHIIGGGVAGVEMACGIKSFFNLNNILNSSVEIYERNNAVCKSESSSIQRAVSNKLSDLGINIHLGVSTKINSYFDSSIPSENQLTIYTQATTLPDINHDLQLTSSRYFEVNTFLQSTSNENVFVCGDSAEIKNLPLAKAGVYSIRQSEYIISNILAYSNRLSLREYIPQRTFLKIINFCDGTALFSWKCINFTSWIALVIKNFIDDSFLKTFRK